MTPIDYDSDETYTLTRTVDHEEVQVYVLGPKDGSRSMSTVFTFLDISSVREQRIVITGDLVPGRKRALGSEYGYGLGWFIRRNGHEYMLSKFLDTSYQPTVARAWLEGKLDEVYDELVDALDDGGLEIEDYVTDLDGLVDSLHDTPAHEAAERLVSVLEAIEDYGESFDDENDFGYWHVETFGVTPEDQAYGYDPDEVSLLGELQGRFARLYRATFGAENKSTSTA